MHTDNLSSAVAATENLSKIILHIAICSDAPQPTETRMKCFQKYLTVFGLSIHEPAYNVRARGTHPHTHTPVRNVSGVELRGRNGETGESVLRIKTTNE